MRDFLRSFALTFSLTLILFFGLLTMNALSGKTEQSGFSSGEFFYVESGENSFSVELLGKKAELDYSPVIEFLPKTEPMVLFLPPSAELLIRGIISIYYPKTAFI